ncbi:MAG: hypothetical protein OXC15_15825, partial [Rhodospirillaceae bacterium]|nr:hypothetical protein [Rhodospirillaceae bacterium]
MTGRMTHIPRGPALPAAAIAALLLAGCSSGHVGDTWQCPLAEGGACDSVAAADPAVPDAGAARKTLLAEPLWRQRAAEPGSPAPAPCEEECGGGFDPFGWLMRLFGGGTAEEKKTAATGPTRLLPTEAPTPSGLLAEPAGAPLPAEPDAPEILAGAEDLYGADLRTDEVVARIWIAP